MRLIAPAIAVSLLVLLTACDPGTAESTPPVPAEPSATASVDAVVDEDETPQPTTVLLRTQYFAILDEDDAVIEQFDYFDSPTGAIAALSEAFGGEPATSHYEGHLEQAPGTFYSWDGFTLLDYDGPAVAYGEDFEVSTTAAVVRGLAVETVGLVTVGTTAAQVAAAGGLEVIWDGSPLLWYEVDAVPGTDPEWAEWAGGSRISVTAAIASAGGPVTSLTAPSANYGP